MKKKVSFGGKTFLAKVKTPEDKLVRTLDLMVKRGKALETAPKPRRAGIKTSLSLLRFYALRYAQQMAGE